jgi:hypothetical protein
MPGHPPPASGFSYGIDRTASRGSSSLRGSGAAAASTAGIAARIVRCMARLLLLRRAAGGVRTGALANAQGRR